jgi:hypothetical protein
VRQLEYRIADLSALAERLQAARAAAADEATRAQQALSQPFKHADATTRSQQIAAQMRDRQQPAPDTERSAGADAAVGDTTAELQRLTRASFPAPAAGARPSTATPARRSPPAPERDPDVSR